MTRALAALLLLAALAGAAQAAAAPAIEVTAAAAWKGWSRPERSTEVDLRLRSDRHRLVDIEVTSATQRTRARLELEAGAIRRLQIPVHAARELQVTVTSADDEPRRLDLSIAPSESPLLGVALGAGEAVALPGFHALALGAEDFARQPLAYSSLDALVVDARTLGTLEPPQLDAFLAAVAACGRTVVVGADSRLRQQLDGAASCNGRALMFADSPAQAVPLLQASLGERLEPLPGLAGSTELTQPARQLWSRVALGLGLYVALAALATLLGPTPAVLAGLGAAAAVAALALPRAWDPSAATAVWSEADSGSQVARYQGRQSVVGVARAQVRVPVPALWASARPCVPSADVALEFDADSARVVAATLRTRLFGQASLCTSGYFPMNRALAARLGADSRPEVVNAGQSAWPPGLLLAAGQTWELPPLAAGQRAVASAVASTGTRENALRFAASRVPAGAAAALWPLDFAGVAGALGPAGGWLLVTAASP